MPIESFTKLLREAPQRAKCEPVEMRKKVVTNNNQGVQA